MLKYRNVISVVVAISFALVGLSGILMKFVLKSHFINEAHTWIGMTMVVAAVLHLILNWKPFASYFRKRWLYALTLPFAAFLLVLALAQGSEGDKKGGPALFGKLAQARVSDLAPVFGKTPEQALATLQAAGLTVSSTSQTAAEISQQNHRKPDAVLGLLAQ